MATKYYVGIAQPVPGVRRLTIAGAPAAGDTVTVTVTGSGKFVTYTLVTGDTAASVVTALLALWAASRQGEITEISAVVDPASSAAILFTGPADGATFTITSTKTGGVTVTDANVTTETGPHHADNTANYSPAGLPAGTDTLVFGAGTFGPKYALTALAAIALTLAERRPEFVAQVGLTEVSPNGYQEYRTKFLQLNTAALTWAQTANDTEQQFRIQTVTTACTVNTTGIDPSRAGGPVLEITGLVATSTVSSSGASLGLDYRAGQSGAPATISATDSTLFTGPGCVASGALTINDTTAELWGNFSSLTVNGTASTVTARGTAAATGANGTTVNNGSVLWKSSGDPTGSGTTVNVRGGATFDVSEAPVVLPTIAFVASAGSTINNIAGRITTPYTVNPDGCRLDEINHQAPPNLLGTFG